jgi:uncharacterized protein
MSEQENAFERPQAIALRKRLLEPRRFIQVVTGPRQVGKSTLVQQVCTSLPMPQRYASADEPTLRSAEWITQQWDMARRDGGERAESLLILDEVQKIPAWSEAVKRLWDEDTRAKRKIKIVLLGSAPLLLARGLTESLAGRFETVPLTHWTLSEMRAAFGWTVDQYIYFGGYPGAAPLIAEESRWSRYIADSLIETSIARDVLLLARVDKPALLRRLFELACHYSGQILSYTKMLGQLHDAGNSTTLAYYLELLAGAGMVRGLTKYAGDQARQRGSSPKLQVLNTALMSALSSRTFAEAREDREFWGRLVESAVGGHLAGAEAMGLCRVHYWRERNHEVDFVVQVGRRLIALEVKSGRAPTAHAGSAAFASAFRADRQLLIGGDGIGVEEFLSQPVMHWLGK